LSLLIGTPICAMAAPVCLVIPGASPRCIYYDGASCARDAVWQHGNCQINPDDTTAGIPGGYCLADNAGYQACGYMDANFCLSLAVRQNKTCVPAVTDFRPTFPRFKDPRFDDPGPVVEPSPQELR
jgi:hypothetical protein